MRAVDGTPTNTHKGGMGMSEGRSLEAQIEVLRQENLQLRARVQERDNYIFEHGLRIGLVPLPDDVDVARKRRERAEEIVKIQRGE